MCTTTGVRRLCGRRLYFTSGRILIQLQQHSGCWDLDGNSIHLFFPIRLLGTITRGVLRLFTQLEAILDSVPAVTV